MHEKNELNFVELFVNSSNGSATCQRSSFCTCTYISF